ncbi:MAG: dephospho-CoA kinase [Pseudomonadota bacterium]
MKVIGLTGSIGMGKSTTAEMFAAHGDAVWDADAAVHALYAGRAVARVGQFLPFAVVVGVVDRKRLGAAVIGKADALRALEAVVHPMVKAAELAFLAEERAKGTAIAVLDIPLLLETRRSRTLDAVVVVSAPADVQQARVMARPGMTVEPLLLME